MSVKDQEDTSVNSGPKTHELDGANAIVENETDSSADHGTADQEADADHVAKLETESSTPSQETAASPDEAIAPAGPASNEQEVEVPPLVIDPDAKWPPPVFIRPGASARERYYIEHRWFTQWTHFDKKAIENKRRYFSLQLIIGIGSVVVPVLVSFASNIASLFDDAIIGRQIVDFFTVGISLSVAIAATVEGLNKYGEMWRSYRQAAEELTAEKSFYDMHSGRYTNLSDPFSRFVERCEEIMAQQNGRFIQSTEQQQLQSNEQVQQILEQYRSGQNSVASGVGLRDPKG